MLTITLLVSHFQSQWCMHVLEIVFLALKEQVPIQLLASFPGLPQLFFEFMKKSKELIKAIKAGDKAGDEAIQLQCTHTHTHTHMYTHTHTMHTHIHTHSRVHTYMHTMHTHMHTPSLRVLLQRLGREEQQKRRREMTSKCPSPSKLLASLSQQVVSLPLPASC